MSEATGAAGDARAWSPRVDDDGDGAGPDAPAVPGWRSFAAGALVVLVVALGLSRFASTAPDGLERVVDQHAVAVDAAAQPMVGAPFGGLDDDGLAGTAVAATGVVAVLALGMGAAWVAGRTWRGAGTTRDGRGSPRAGGRP